MHRTLVWIGSHGGCPNEVRLIAHEAAGLSVKTSAAETAGYAKCVHSMADAIGVAEEQWSIDGFCAACAWHASRVKTSEGGGA